MSASRGKLRSLALKPVLMYLDIVGRVRASGKEKLSDDLRTVIDGHTAELESSLVPGGLRIFAPNDICRFRASSFSTKEPETLAWIREFGGAGAFVDVGANVGIYSLYYAAIHPGNVYAIEASADNVALLTRNIALNGFESRISVIPLPVTDHDGLAPLRLGEDSPGGAMASFGVDYGHDGEQLDTERLYRTVGFKIDTLLQLEILPNDAVLLKLDVDGIEHLIIAGARKFLRSGRLASVLVEVNDNFAQLSRQVSIELSEAGFELRDKTHSPMFEGGSFGDTYNQIWIRTH